MPHAVVATATSQLRPWRQTAGTTYAEIAGTTYAEIAGATYAEIAGAPPRRALPVYLGLIVRALSVGVWIVSVARAETVGEVFVTAIRKQREQVFTRSGRSARQLFWQRAIALVHGICRVAARGLVTGHVVGDCRVVVE